MKDVAALIGVLAWPFVVMFLAIFYRSEIRQILKSVGELLPRVKKGHLKLAGQEIDAELSELHREAVTGADEVAALPPAEAAPLGDPAKTSAPSGKEKERWLDADRRIDKILREAAISPKLGLLALSSEIDRTVSEILAGSGLSNGRRYMPPRQAVLMLRSEGLLPDHVQGSLELFWGVRNRLVHGGYEAQDGDTVIRAIDSGLIILKALLAIPFERHFVAGVDIPLFTDAGCSHQCGGALGVLLSTLGPGGNLSEKRQVFPTSQSYRIGQQVSWEWDAGNVFGETWYRDPDTGQSKLGWLSSAEFIGRPLGEGLKKDD